MWLYGTQSEHNVFSQYQLTNARNVFMTMIQSGKNFCLSNLLYKIYRTNHIVNFRNSILATGTKSSSSIHSKCCLERSHLHSLPSCRFQMPIILCNRSETMLQCLCLWCWHVQFLQQ